MDGKSEVTFRVLFKFEQTQSQSKHGLSKNNMKNLGFRTYTKHKFLCKYKTLFPATEYAINDIQEKTLTMDLAKLEGHTEGCQVTSDCTLFRVHKDTFMVALK